ncbi:MAG TPA: flavin reductase family protein, partial [Pontibacter sp.]
IFELPKPVKNKGIGIDMLPAHIRNSTILTGNNLARLGNSETIPTAEEVDAYRAEPIVAYTINKYQQDPATLRKELQLLGKQLLENNQVQEAWRVLLMIND